ncbi:MAG: DUF6600 domain-containing protein [Myxococcales bacterium]
MVTSRSCLTAALAAMLVFSAAARAQLMPEGHPPGEHPWALAHYWVWHDGGGWHLRVTTEGQYHQFQGWIDSPGGVGAVNPVVPGTPLSVNWRQVQFNVGVQGGENGFDWQQPSPCVQLSLLQDGKQQPWGVDVGAYAGHPPSYAPFELCAGAPFQPPVAEAAPPPEEAADVETPLGPEMDPDAFQPVLAPYGSWVDLPPYGLVWQPSPAVVGSDFTPYSSGGHWVYSDAGWTWSSDYPWGWAPFHYGNWIFAAGSWDWIPGRVWAPAWVSWRYGGGAVGWAPLGPGGAVERVPYVFVEARRMTEANLRYHLITGPRAIEYERRAPVILSARYAGGRAIVPVRAGPPPREIERAVGHPIRPVAMAQLSRRAMPPVDIRGVHYAPGASASRPFVRQTVHVAPAERPLAAPRPENVREGEHPTYERSPSEPRGAAYNGYRPPERPQERPMAQPPERQPYQGPVEQRPIEGRPAERPAAAERPMGGARPMAPPPPKQEPPPPPKSSNKKKR